MKRFILVLLLTCISLLTGCWDYIEYNNLSQVYALAIDYDPITHLVSLSEQHFEGGADGSGSGSSSKDSGTKELPPKGLVHSATDYTISDTLDRIQQSVSNKLFFGYLKVIIIGEDAAKHITRDIIEFLSRTPAIKPTTYLIITEGKAKESIRTYDSESLVPAGKILALLFDTVKYTGSSFKVSINDFKLLLLREGHEPVIPRLITTVTKEKKEQENPDEKIFVDQQAGHHKLLGMGVFKKDKFVGWLNPEETEGLALIKNEEIRNFQSIGENNSANNNAIFMLTDNSSKIKPELKNEKLVMNVSIEAKAVLKKYFTEKAQLITPEITEMLESELSESLKAKVLAAIKKAQKEFDSDIFGFGFEFFRKYPSIWNNEYQQKWNKIFQDLEVQVDVKAKVINTGTNIESLDSGD